MNSGVRVLHILPSVRGYGAERAIVDLVTRLSATDIEPALLTIYDYPFGTGDGFPFRLLSAGRRNRSDRFFLWKMVEEIRRYRPDIVHTHTHVGKYWGRAAAFFAGVSRIVHTEHNPCDFRHRTALERFADSFLHRVTSRIITFFGEQRVCLSEFERLPMDKIVVIPNGLESPQEAGDRAEARARLGLTNDQFAVMLVGRMEYQKNHELALRALAALNPQAREKTVLLFAGAGEQEAALTRTAQSLDLSGRVRFLGYRSDVNALLAGVDLLLMTSWFEGMPLALLEAMFAGVPIVSTPWRGAQDMLGNGRFGMIASSFEPHAVAAKIELALARPETRHGIAQHARDHARAVYDISRMTERHRRLYLELAGEAS